MNGKEPDDTAHVPKIRMEFVELIESRYKNNPKYENVKIRLAHDGINIEYDLIAPEPEDPEIVAQLKEVFKNCRTSEIPEINTKHQKCFIPYHEF